MERPLEIIFKAKENARIYGFVNSSYTQNLLVPLNFLKSL